MSPHQRAIYRLSLELKAREGLFGWFHAGVTWRALQPLVPAGASTWIEQEKGLRFGNKRYVPDLVVRRSRGGPIVLLIEVRHTHAVKGRKRTAFNQAGIPWIEVRSWHVLSRRRKQPLPVLDWGGGTLPQPPHQGALFEDGSGIMLRAATNARRSPRAVRSVVTQGGCFDTAQAEFLRT